MKKNIFNKSFSWFLLLLFLLFFISPSVSAKSIGQDSLDSGTLLYQQGKFETAKEAFESAVKLDPGLLQAWDNVGWANLKVGEKEEAVRIWTMLLKIEPGQLKLINAIGLIYFEEGKNKEAIKHFESSLNVDASQPPVQARLGELYEKEKDYQKSKIYYKNAISLSPNNPDLHIKLSKVYQKSGDIILAISLLNKYIKKNNPTNFKTYNYDVYFGLFETYQSAVNKKQEYLSTSKILSSLKIYPLGLDNFQKFSYRLHSGNHNNISQARTFCKSLQPAISNCLIRSRFADQTDFLKKFSKNERLVRTYLAGLLFKRGNSFFQQEKFDKAEETYRSANEVNPENFRYLENLAWSLRKQSDHGSAIQLWLEILMRHPERNDLYKHIADAYLDLKINDTATVLYQKASHSHPSNANLLFRLFKMEMKNANIKTAFSHLNKLFQSENADELWSHKSQNIFIASDKLIEGTQFFQKRLKTSKRPDLTKNILSLLLLKQGVRKKGVGRFIEAEHYYIKALQFNQGSWLAYRDLGWLYWNMEAWGKCEQAWNKYAKLKPNSTVPFNLLIRLHLNQKNFNKTQKAIDKSLSIEPDQPDIKLKQIKNLYWTKNYSEAHKKIIPLVNEYPNHILIQSFFGSILNDRHDFEKASRQWKKVLDLNPNYSKAHYYWVRAIYETGNYDLAKKEAENYIKNQNPTPHYFWLFIHDALYREKEHETIYWYQQLLNNFPDNRVAWKEMAQIYLEQKKYNLANTTLNSALKIFPGDIEILLTVADLKQKLGRHVEAINMYKEIQSSNTGNKRAFIGLFHALKGDEKYSDARKLLDSNKNIFLKDYEVELEKGKLWRSQREINMSERYYKRMMKPSKEIFYLPVILYHGLGHQPRSKDLPVDLFDSQMKALHDSGYQSVSVEEISDMMAGKKPFVKNPILITFDDARIDSFSLADPILQKYGFKATMFVPTIRIHSSHPFFADWDMIRYYQDTNRWEIQSHGHRAHDSIPVGPGGASGNFLTDFRWIADQNQPESSAEYRSRLEEDYLVSIKQIKAEVNDVNVLGYAYPFSEAGQTGFGNSSISQQVNENILKKYFQFGFLQDQSGYNRITIDKNNSQYLWRLSVPPDWEGHQLTEHLAKKNPQNIAQIALAKSKYWNGKYAQAEEIFLDLQNKEPDLKKETQFYLADISFKLGRYRLAQKQISDHLIQAFEETPRVTNLRQNISGKNNPRVTASSNYFSDSNDRSNLLIASRLEYPLDAPIDLFVETGYLNIAENGFQGLQGGHFLGGASYWKGSFKVQGAFRHRVFNNIDSTQGFLGSLEYSNDILSSQIDVSHLDIDTIQALEENIQVTSYGLTNQIRISPHLRGVVSGSFQNYSDNNERINFHAGLLYRFQSFEHWKVGGDIFYSDSKFQATEYYTPEKLIVGIAKIHFNYRWGTDASFRADIGAGGANDMISGTRPVIRFGMFYEKKLFENINGSVKVNYSSVPGYKSINFNAGLAYQF